MQNPKDDASLNNSNLVRKSTTISAGTFFVIAATLAILAILAMYWITGIKSSCESLNEYGYPMLIYENEEVPYGSYQYQSYHYGFMEDDNPEEYAKYEARVVYFDIEFDNDLYSRYMGILWIIEIASLFVAGLSLVFAIMKSGSKEPDGTIRIGWFDRIFVEVDIALAVLATIGLIVPFYLSQAWLHNSQWGDSLFRDLINQNANASTIQSWMDFRFFDRTLIEYVFEPKWILLALTVIGTLLIVTFDLIALLSIVRRLKARRFWRSTILGSILHALFESTASNPALSGKVLGVLIGSVILMFLGAAISIGVFGYDAILPIAIGALAIIGLILIFVPQQIKKYETIRTGINELQKGNFTYKVPDLGAGELGRLANSVNSISEAQDLAIQNELKSQRLRTDLISNVSHDIRTPLTSTISYIDLLKKEGLDGPNAEEYLKIISDKTDRLKKLTDDLFEAAKASSGDIPVEIEKLDMNAIVGQALAELDETINSNNIEVILTNHAENTMVYADGKLLWRVIENILTNVTKYSLTGTRAYMDIFEKEDRVVLEVKNVSRDQLNISSQELLERFKRGDSSRNTEGSGLGLAIASDLTSLMGGNFDIFIDGDLFKAVISLNKAHN